MSRKNLTWGQMMEQARKVGPGHVVKYRTDDNEKFALYKLRQAFENKDKQSKLWWEKKLHEYRSTGRKLW